MQPATLHGIEVITKLYFAIFAAFKESMTLNWYQSKARIHIPISGQLQLGPYPAPFQRYGGLCDENGQFSIPHSYAG